jgi:hypothetical protein
MDFPFQTSVRMLCAVDGMGFLLERLIEIERAIAVKDSSTIRNMAIEAQDCVLQMQKETAENLRPKQGPDPRSLDPFVCPQ